MRLTGTSCVSLAVYFETENEYFCGFIKNPAACEEKASALIAPFFETDKEVLCAYWAEDGFLKLEKRDAGKFENNFCRANLTGAAWNEKGLELFLEFPPALDAPEIRLCSRTGKNICEKAQLSVENTGLNPFSSIWKLEAELDKMDASDSDGYSLDVSFIGRSFKVYADKNFEDEQPAQIALSEGGQLKAGIISGRNGEFILKTGNIYPALLSVVTAVYNTEPFLDEMIESVLSQKTAKIEALPDADLTGDYYKNIFEFILVDDGSTDNSGEILDDYAMLSDKIKVIHKENGGVSSARNAGIEIAQGKYITFPDSDDKLSNNVFEDCLLYFEQHEDEISLAAYPVRFFDAQKGNHWTDFRFKEGTQIIDIVKYWARPQYFTNSAFFKTADIKNKIFFDTNLINGEDIKFVYEVIFSTTTEIGLVSTPTYWYRRRSTGEPSAIQESKDKESYYIPYVRDLLYWMVNTSREKDGSVRKYVQYAVMGQLQWRFAANDKGEPGKEIIGEEKYREYKELIFSLLTHIGSDIVLAQTNIWSEHLYYILRKKFKRKPELVRDGDNAFFMFGTYKIPTGLGDIYTRLDFLHIENDTLHIEGFSMNFDPDAELVICMNDKPVPYTHVERDADKYCFDEVVMFAESFSADIVLDHDIGEYSLSFRNVLDGIDVLKKPMRFTKNMPLAITNSKSYCLENGWAARKEGPAIMIRTLSSDTAMQTDFEGEFESQIEGRIKKAGAAEAGRLKEALNLRRKALRLLSGKNPKKKIWLVFDRVMEANDNGEAMFRYLSRIKDPDTEAYFVIDEGSADFERMKEFGDVIPFGSEKHYLMLLICDYIVSSSGDEHVFNPWYLNYSQCEVLRDLLARPKFIFLQHGIIKDDLSSWLNKYNKHITGFVCTAPREAQSILDYEYYYKPENVWLTGLPRHDRLHTDEKNYITIMPTWRHWLAHDKLTNKPGDDFAESDFFKFYNDLLSDERLLKAADECGYTICFMPHPSIQPVINLFNHDSRVKFFASEKPYHEIFAESSLVVTDYSSTSMDFSLLKKPVVYCQFDKEEFFANHTYTEGYYDYEEDGFGEVTYDMEALIDVIISYMKNGCRLKEKYEARIDEFFIYHDRNNCERVYKKIKELD